MELYLRTSRYFDFVTDYMASEAFKNIHLAITRDDLNVGHSKPEAWHTVDSIAVANCYQKCFIPGFARLHLLRLLILGHHS